MVWRGFSKAQSVKHLPQGEPCGSQLCQRINQNVLVHSSHLIRIKDKRKASEYIWGWEKKRDVQAAGQREALWFHSEAQMPPNPWTLCPALWIYKKYVWYVNRYASVKIHTWDLNEIYFTLSHHHLFLMVKWLKSNWINLVSKLSERLMRMECNYLQHNYFN